MWVQQSEQISGSKISFEPRAEEDRSISESKIRVEPRAEEEQNHSKSRAEEERNITSNLVRKRKEVIKSSRTLNLVRKRGKASIDREFRTSCGRGREHYFKSRAKEWRNHKIIKNHKPQVEEDQSINSWEFQTSCGLGKEHQTSQLLRISDGREFELQSLSENFKPCTEQGQNIRYHQKIKNIKNQKSKT